MTGRAGLLGLFLLSLALPWPASALDPHRVFEQRCARCHDEHSGTFVAEAVVLRDSTLVGRRNGRTLERFLVQHGGGSTAEEIAALLEMFSRQLVDGGFFRQRCGHCHGSARELARLHLIARDGRLLGRYSGRDMADFLRRHGRSDAAEADRLHAMLLWQLEVLQAD